MARAMKDSGIEWIGEIPEDWSVQKAKYFISLCDGGIWGNDPDGSDNDMIVLRSTEQNIDGTWNIVSPALRCIRTEAGWESNLLKAGDLVITKSSGSSAHIGKTSIISSQIEAMQCCCSNFMQRIRLNKCILPKLAWYFFNSDFVRSQFSYMSNTTSGINNINATMIKETWLPLIPVGAQVSIVHYLDTKCAEIDAVLEKTRASIEEYKKLKQAVITQAVTKGVRGEREMKESGIEWLPAIPAGWEIGKLGRYITIKSNLVSPDGYMDYVQISPECIEKDSCNLIKRQTVAEAGVISWNHLFYKGQIIYSKVRPLLNKVIIAPCDGLCSADMYPIETSCEAKFIVYVFLSTYFSYQVKLLTENRVKMPKINQNELSGISVLIPSMAEQQEIVAYLDMKCSEMDKLIAKKEQFITELETYKKSLIYEYVTGKKEVPQDV